MLYFLMLVPLLVVGSIFTNGEYGAIYPIPFLIYALLVLFLSFTVKKPENGLYLFVLSIFLIPHVGNKLPIFGDYFPGLDTAVVFKCFSVMGLVFLLLRFKGRQHVKDRELERLFALFYISLFSSVFYGYYLLHNIEISIPAQSIFMQFLVGSIGGLAFWLALRKFLVEKSHFEKIIQILFIGGLLLLGEYLLAKLMPISALQYLQFHETGRFRSLIYLNYDKVGFFSMLGIISANFLFVSSGKMRYIFCSALFFLVNIACYQRIGILSPVLATAAFFWLYTKKKVLWSAVFIGSCSLFLILDSFELWDGIQRILGDESRQGSFYSLDSTFVRFALWLRTIDVAIYTFPFGAGEGMVRSFLEESNVIANFGRIAGEINFETQQYYSYYTQGGKGTDTHNFFVRFVAERGVMGILLIGMALLQIFKVYSSLEKISQNKDRAVISCFLSMGVGAAIILCFESSFECYLILGALIFLPKTYLNMVLERNKIAETYKESPASAKLTQFAEEGG